MLTKIKEWAGELKRKLIVIHLAYQDDRTPWYAKALIMLILAYALSPMDLIPDFIPVLGLLDDLILLPIAIYFAVRLIPNQVLSDATEKALTYEWSKDRNLFGLVIISLIWLLAAWLVYTYFSS
ncbi:YkvA family protein [Persicitalea sp.]|uniref:YkvA family protein n=1 Tax=Persicitalea sp. TaxID=3100273 RepID=UPI003594929A